VPGRAREAEQDGAGGDDRQADEDSWLHAGARRDHPARDRADERARRVCGRKNARAGLPEP
jgi:hypothetical protein